MNNISKWFSYSIFLIIAGIAVFLLHESGHYIAAALLGFDPAFSFSDGGRIICYDQTGQLMSYHKLTNAQALMFSAGGPLMTFLMAIVFYLVYVRYKKSFMLFSMAMMFSVQRLNMIVDGLNSDEGNISLKLIERAGPMMAYLVPILSWSVYILLSAALIRQQSFMKKSYWLIPVFFILAAVIQRLTALGLFQIFG